MFLHVTLQISRVTIVPLSQNISDGGLVQSLLLVEKLGHWLRPPFQQVILNQVMETLQEGRMGSQICMKSI